MRTPCEGTPSTSDSAMIWDSSAAISGLTPAVTRALATF